MNVVLLLGSNVGDSHKVMLEARNAIEKIIGKVLVASTIHQTKPWGLLEQDDYLNQALVVQSSLPPIQLMPAILAIEQQLGRERGVKWGPRTIDIDVLAIDSLEIKTLDLTVPHPFLAERLFALAPMAEICPDWIHPTFGKGIQELIASLT